MPIIYEPLGPVKGQKKNAGKAKPAGIIREEIPPTEPLRLTRAFTLKMPQYVLLVLGMKEWDNRASYPDPPFGTCGVSISKSSTRADYEGFLQALYAHTPPELHPVLPTWDRLKDFRGELVGVVDYEADFTPGDPAWDEGYPVWWRLTNYRPILRPFPVRGKLGMWTLDANVDVLLLPDDTRVES